MIHSSCHNLLNNFTPEAMQKFIIGCDGEYGAVSSLQDILQGKNGISVNEAFICKFGKDRKIKTVFAKDYLDPAKEGPATHNAPMMVSYAEGLEYVIRRIVYIMRMQVNDPEVNLDKERRCFFSFTSIDFKNCDVFVSLLGKEDREASMFLNICTILKNQGFIKKIEDYTRSGDGYCLYV